MKSCYFTCDRHSELQNIRKLQDKKCKHQIKSRKIECSFKFIVCHQRHQDRWKLKLINRNHNHSLTETEETHTVHQHKVFTKEMTECLEIMLNNEVSMIFIHLTLQKEDHLIKKDIHNIINDLFQKQLADKSSMWALLELLQKSDFDEIIMIFDYKINSQNNHLTHLFFVHSIFIEILQKNHNVMLLDCMYKINKFKLSMLNIVFITNVHTMINLRFCFMNLKKKMNYQ